MLNSWFSSDIFIFIPYSVAELKRGLKQYFEFHKVKRITGNNEHSKKRRLPNKAPSSGATKVLQTHNFVHVAG